MYRNEGDNSHHSFWLSQQTGRITLKLSTRARRTDIRAAIVKNLNECNRRVGAWKALLEGLQALDTSRAGTEPEVLSATAPERASTVESSNDGIEGVVGATGIEEGKHADIEQQEDTKTEGPTSRRSRRPKPGVRVSDETYTGGLEEDSGELDENATSY